MEKKTKTIGELFHDLPTCSGPIPQDEPPIYPAVDMYEAHLQQLLAEQRKLRTDCAAPGNSMEP